MGARQPRTRYPHPLPAVPPGLQDDGIPVDARRDPREALRRRQGGGPEVRLHRQRAGPSSREHVLPGLRRDRDQAIRLRHHGLVPRQGQQVQEVRVQARDLRTARGDGEGEPLLQRPVPPLSYSTTRPLSINVLPSTSTPTSERTASTRTPPWIFPPITRLSPNPRCAAPTAFSASRCGPVTRARGFTPKPKRLRARPSRPPRVIVSTPAAAPTIFVACPSVITAVAGSTTGSSKYESTTSRPSALPSTIAMNSSPAGNVG